MFNLSKHEVVGLAKENGFRSETLEKVLRLVDVVKNFILEITMLSSEEMDFLNRFYNGDYVPELIFSSKEILNNINNHPMALWKISNI